MESDDRGRGHDRQTERELRLIAWLLSMSVVVLLALVSLYIFPSVVSEYLSIAEGVIRGFIESPPPRKGR